MFIRVGVLVSPLGPMTCLAVFCSDNRMSLKSQDQVTDYSYNVHLLFQWRGLARMVIVLVHIVQSWVYTDEFVLSRNGKGTQYRVQFQSIGERERGQRQSHRYKYIDRDRDTDRDRDKKRETQKERET